jgi:putative membrane protein
MMYWGHGLGLVGALCAGLIAVLLIVAIGALIAWAIRAFSRPQPAQFDRLPAPGAEASSSALTIAQERYARGEITKEQYEEIRQTLLS